MPNHVSAHNQIRTLKKRRDELVNRSCNRQEREVLLAELAAINRQIQALEPQPVKLED